MTKLLDLQPRWLSPNFFIFQCPHCRKNWLSCKNIHMGMREQRELVESVGMNMREVAPCNESTCWTFSGDDFALLTVTPSIDASKAGCWHGFITQGEVR